MWSAIDRLSAWCLQNAHLFFKKKNQCAVGLTDSVHGALKTHICKLTRACMQCGPRDRQTQCIILSKRTFVQLQTRALWILAYTAHSATQRPEAWCLKNSPFRTTANSCILCHWFLLFYFIFCMQSVQWDRKTGSMVPVGSSARDSTPSDSFGDLPLGHAFPLFSLISLSCEPLSQP